MDRHRDLPLQACIVQRGALFFKEIRKGLGKGGGGMGCFFAYRLGQKYPVFRVKGV